MDRWITLISTLGAAIIGGLIAPLISQRRERATARAEVRRALAEVETRRFEPSEYREFARALASFEANAILAGLPRQLVFGYAAAVENYRSEVRFEEVAGPDGEPGYVIDVQHVIKAHARELERVSESLWHPWLTKWRWGPRPGSGIEQ